MEPKEIKELIKRLDSDQKRSVAKMDQKTALTGEMLSSLAREYGDLFTKCITGLRAEERSNTDAAIQAHETLENKARVVLSLCMDIGMYHASNASANELREVLTDELRQNEGESND
tara:strand:- start:24 stop:371 length:348 start_codon:yes stop_codon:yes gene_type:complete